MPMLSGTLRFWSGDDAPTVVRLDRVEFAWQDTWEPSLIVEEIYLATVGGRRVRYAEFEGIGRGLGIRVEGAEHAELVDWVKHVGDATVPGPPFVDSIVLELAPGWGG
ncbi:MAG: hypothetical protein KC549_08500 [Myxococcales bacterium]|nr:hypothetical protein [Myxococcales bacterium]MCB9548041.1 hypothetical protein [Myxococcales bacterium]